jgi:hypothetical protein
MELLWWSRFSEEAFGTTSKMKMEKLEVKPLKKSCQTGTNSTWYCEGRADVSN